MSNALTTLRLGPLQRIVAARAKSFTQPAGAQGLFGGAQFTGLLPATSIDYAEKVGDGLRSSVLMGPLNWLMRNFPEAPPIVERLAGSEWAEKPAHSLLKILKRPNPYYGGTSLWMATMCDFAFGNAYWVKIRNAAGEVVQLWWVPRYMMAPRWPMDGSEYISHYDYRVGGRAFQLPVRDVVHFRFGLDPNNTRLGLSPLGSIMREVAMDDNAAAFATAILENLGVIGIVISPEGNAGTASKGALEETKRYMEESFGGDRRGRPLALGAATKVQLLQYNMQGFDVSPLRDVSEERVCAALGIPAAVVGFGTGLQQTKVGATMKEMRQLAWTGGLMPLQKIISDEIDRSLLPDFDGAPDNKRMRFDTSHVRALWEDSSEKHNRVRADYLAGIIRRDEARRETGRSYEDSDRVYVQPVNVVQIDAAGDAVPIAGAATGAPHGTIPDPDSEESDDEN